MSRSFIFSSESVGEGHPDKVADTISDAVLDACLTIDPKSRVACETFVKSNIVVVGGEITIPKIGHKPIGEVINIDKTIRDAVRGIGYLNDDDVFHADRIFINNYLTTQSPDIAQGVDAKKATARRPPSRELATKASCLAMRATRRRNSCPRPSCSHTG